MPTAVSDAARSMPPSTMNRRDFVRAGAVIAGVGSLVGCTEYRLQEAEREPPLIESIPDEEIDLPVTQRLAIAAEGIERAADAEVRDSHEFEEYLDTRGVRVETIEESAEAEARSLTLEYAPEIEEGLMGHLGVVAGGYAVLIEATHDSEKLEAHLLDPDGEEFGEYEVRRGWAEKYNAGEYTARKYADEIAVTVEST